MEHKNNKRLIIIIISFLLVLVLSLCLFFVFKDKIKNNDKNEDDIQNVDLNKKDEEEVATATPLLYEVTKDGEGTKIYLFGSIHAADERAYPMQEKILNAFKESEYLAVEVDIVALQKNIKAQIELVKMFLCEDGKTLKDYLSPEGYEIIIKYMKDNGIYESAYEMYKPGLIYSLISNVTVQKSNLDTNDGIDMYFLKKAKKSKKSILEVESAEMQYELLANMPSEIYELMMLAYIEAEEQEVASLKEMYEAWLNGDIEKFLENSQSDDIESIKATLSEDEMQEFEKIMELLNEFNESMFGERNVTMTEVVDNYFKEGKNVFVVVGAAHVVGEEGLVNELSKLGYKVELVKYN